MFDFYSRFIPLGFLEILKRIPYSEEFSFLPPYWLHLELIERYRVLQHAHITAGMQILEIGCGPHALATIPLAYLVGETGHLTAVELTRWGNFKKLIEATRLSKRVTPFSCDARKLPFSYRLFDVSLLIHGLRSFKDEETIVSVFKEMLRVSNRVFIATTLPTGKTRGQQAHLEMYNLREEIFEALYGVKDDIHYFPLKKIIEFANSAGGCVLESKVIDIDMPHFLGFIPRDYVEKIKDPEKRSDLLKRWEQAYEKIKKYGEEHPPVGIVTFIPKR